MKTYTYDSANRLIEVSDQSTVTSLSYNGLGQRLSMDAAGVIATYVLDGNSPLIAESNGNTTFYLYGLGAIGEKTTVWNFSLPDGTNTPRQLSDSSGNITLSARYTPWGGALETYGNGNFSFGYLGGILDVATNLIYVGNGQYYDPQTGRFLTRDVNPDSTNPYIPWNPIGAILGPLGLISLVASRRKKGGKVNPYLLMFVMLVVLPVGIGMACISQGPTDVTVVVTPDGTATITFGDTTVVASITPNPGSALTPLAIPCPTPTPLPTLELFGITFGSTAWTFDEQAKILAAVQKVGEQFSRLGLGGTSWDAFKAVYGEGFLFYRDQSGASYCNGGSEQRKIVCFGNAPMSEIDPVRLLVHELGHALVQTRYPGSRNPYTQLRDARIVDDNPEFLGGPRWVTGTHPTWNDCQSNSDPNSDLGKQCAATETGYYGQFQRTSLGYTGRDAPHQYHGEGWEDFPTNPNEDYADMFMNWAYNTFDYSPQAFNAGVKRYNFMEFNMLAWITG